MAKKRAAKRPRKKAAKKGKAVAKRPAPPLKPIDEQKLENDIAEGKTVPNAALRQDVSEDTLQRRCAGTLKKGRQRRNSRLQEEMFKAAMGGNSTMQIWLSKQWLGMTEPQKVQMFGDDVARVAGRTAAEFDKETVTLIFEKVQARISRGETSTQEESDENRTNTTAYRASTGVNQRT